MKTNKIMFCIVVMILLFTMLVACSGDIKSKGKASNQEYNYIQYTMNNGQTWVKYKIVNYEIYENGTIEFEKEDGEKLLIHCSSWLLSKE